jgi:hypothetical protein
MITFATNLAWNFRVDVVDVGPFTQIRPYWIQNSSIDLTDDEIKTELKRCNLEQFTEDCLKSIRAMEEKRELQKS